MKTQNDRGNGNKQISDDDTTTQVQIGNKALTVVLCLVLVSALLVIWKLCS